MKKSFIVLLITAGIFYFTATPVYAIDAEGIIKKMIEAQGGRGKLESIKSSVITGSLILIAQGNMAGNLKIYQVEPDKVRSEVEIMGMKIVNAYDGKTAWTDNPMAGGVSIISGPDAAILKRNALGNKSLLYPGKYGIKYVLKGKEKVKDLECYVLEQIHKSGFKAKLYIDTGKFLIRKSSSRVESSQGTFNSDRFYSDYKKTDGLLNAHKTIMFRDGVEFLAVNLTKINYNPKIDSSIFTMQKK